MLIHSGEIVALGGIYETITQKIIYRVPVLSRIPLLAYLFSQRGYTNSTRERIVFVTPHLISNTLLKERQQRIHL